MSKNILVSIIICILLLTSIGFFLIFSKGAKVAQPENLNTRTNVQTAKDVIQYKNPEDGWGAVMPLAWELTDQGVDDSELFSYIEYFPKEHAGNNLTVDIVVSQITEELEEDIEGFKKSRSDGYTAYTNEESKYSEEWKQWEYFSEVYIVKGDKQYYFDARVRSDSERKYDEITEEYKYFLKTFKPSPTTIDEISTLNVNDFEKKTRLRNPGGLIDAIVKCNESEGFALRAYEEVISLDYEIWEEFEDTSQFYKDYVLSGCAFSQEFKEANVDVKEGGYCKDKMKKIENTERYPSAMRICKNFSESVKGQYSNLFTSYYDNLFPEYHYKSDGKNWEIWIDLENIDDPECTIVDEKCLYKFRNGQLVTSK